MNKNKLISLLVLFFFSISAIHAQDTAKEKAAIKKLLDLAAVDFGDSKYDSALEHSKKALVRSFTIDDHLLIAQSYNTIGAIFNECSESGKAIEFYNKALSYNEKVGNDKMYNWIYSNLGSVYYFNEIDIPKGIDYYKKALPYAIKNKDTAQIHYTKLNLASAYFALGQYDLGNQQI
ncbi:MAG: hybrid sensor histidine kinase/response regulator, partial [Flavobacterium sp.]|uniref:tetratricopeptide repeat protein n=1 Tax=Flavobacterium sp. TaxID=239 RepID=UPI0025C64953